ncbi:hypothetical protein [Microbacterium sp. EST19A]|uniref:hypothetical protein n=1 Tax=Microbacterium sp. EST19A TaxID=2862681 RepID=UPI001CC145E7|nr:hypothetical protein [Microbacterium sp. EST19A]
MTEQLRLAHRDDCPADRVDITPHDEEGITTLHCLDCASHAAFNENGTMRPEPIAVGPLADVKQGAGFTADMNVAGKRPRMNNQNWSKHD